MDRELFALADPSGVAELEKHWGIIPSFHDAEILRLDLNRDHESHLILRLEDGSQTAEVIFTFEGIEDLELMDFSKQNVVFDVHLERLSSSWRLTISPSYGMGGFIECKALRVGVNICPAKVG